jgi:hypothetical protein
MHTGILIITLKEGHCLEDTDVDERIILKWVLNVMGRYGLNSSGSKCGPAVGSCEHISRTSKSTESIKFRTQLKHY